MNEPATKEEALRLLEQLQSKFNISKRDINESFNKSIEDSNSGTPNTKIRLITVDEAIFKIIIPLNVDKLWNNRIEEYPKEKAFYNNKWYIYWDYWWRGGSGVNLNILQDFKVRADGEVTNCLLNYDNYSYGNSNVVQYQDNHLDKEEVRLYDKYSNAYSKTAQVSGRNEDKLDKNRDYINDSFFPVMTYNNI